jgi:lambda repressor-like predicted transcriptional regulator
MAEKKETVEKKTNKFVEMISANGNDVLKRRAGSLATSAEIAQQTIVNQLKNKIASEELILADLMDLAPESSESLRPGSKGWDPNKWAEQIQTTKQNLYQLKIQLRLAEETYKEYFA